MNPDLVPEEAVREISPIVQRGFLTLEDRDREIRAALARAHPHMVRAAVLSNFTTPERR